MATATKATLEILTESENEVLFAHFFWFSTDTRLFQLYAEQLHSLLLADDSKMEGNICQRRQLHKKVLVEVSYKPVQIFKELGPFPTWPKSNLFAALLQIALCSESPNSCQLLPVGILYHLIRS